MTLEQGDLLYNRYRILEILGRGGMGSVYHAVDESLGVEVAVKENLFVTEDYEQQFRLEAVILASLRHANMPRVTDHFTIENQGQYLVMDYIEGRDLRHMMDNGPLPEEDVLRIGVAVCDALTYLHTRRPAILHRDIKPGNVRIAPDGHVYLVDFGLAKMVNDDEHTLTGARAMTPGYSPPEQYGTSRTDTRTDIYSLAATLYAALTGMIPEDGLARLVDEVKLTPLRKRNPKVSKPVAAAIQKAMEPQAAKRFQSAEEFKQALLATEVQPSITPAEEAAEPAVPVPPVPEPGEEEPQPPRRRALPGRGCTFMLILLALLAAGSVWILNNPSDARASWQAVLVLVAQPTPTSTKPAASPTARASTATTTLAAPGTDTPSPIPASATPTAPVDTMTPSPVITDTETPVPSPTATFTGGGRGEIAFASMQDGLPQIFLVNADGTDLQSLTHEQNGACQPAWSPDGAKLVYISPCAEKSDQYRQSSLSILNVEAGSITALPASFGGSFEPAWSPDGTKIAFTSMVSGYAQIFMLNLNDLSITRLTRDDSPNTQASQAAWSPDGKQLVYMVRRFNLLQIWTIQADGQNAEQLIRNGGGFSDYLPAWSPDGSSVLFSETDAGATLPPSLVRFSFATNKTEAVSAHLPVLDVSFSPDGKWIVYETTQDKNPELYLYDLADGASQRLTNSPALDFDPAWRP